MRITITRNVSKGPWHFDLDINDFDKIQKDGCVSINSPQKTIKIEGKADELIQFSIALLNRSLEIRRGNIK